MIFLELTPGQQTILERPAFAYEELQAELGGRIAGLPFAAGRLIAYHRDGYDPRLESTILIDGVVLRGTVLVMGIGPAGRDRGLTQAELNGLGVEQGAKDFLPTLVWTEPTNEPA